MNKYARTPDQVIDLHGHTKAEADQVLAQLFARTDLRHVRIIVGKGHHSKGAPVIPDHVKRVLTRNGLTYTPAKLADGGEGALEVYL